MEGYNKCWSIIEPLLRFDKETALIGRSVSDDAEYYKSVLTSDALVTSGDGVVGVRIARRSAKDFGLNGHRLKRAIRFKTQQLLTNAKRARLGNCSNLCRR